MPVVDPVVLRQLADERRAVPMVVLVSRNRVRNKLDIVATGRKVSGLDEYIQGTPTARERFIKENINGQQS